jgi:hypothetical protein
MIGVDVVNETDHGGPGIHAGGRELRVRQGGGTAPAGTRCRVGPPGCAPEQLGGPAPVLPLEF